jgi:hypothetical protein
MAHLYDPTQDQERRALKQAFRKDRLNIIANVDATVAEMQSYINAPTITNAGRDTQLMVISKDLRQIVRDLKTVVNTIKSLI